MKFKKFLFIGCFLIAILLMGTVSASDNITADILNADDESSNQLSEETLLIDESQSAGESQIGSFDDLQTEIDNAQEILTLKKNYTFSENNTQIINIHKSIIIDGNGNTLDANRLSGIFYITADNVVLKNINFINSVSVMEDIAISFSSGDSFPVFGCRAICSSGENFSVINCNFENNIAKYGGAVYVVNHNDLTTATFTNCTFKNNSAEFGGAIYSWNTVNILNSTFVNNYANYSGGAIATYVNHQYYLMTDDVLSSSDCLDENIVSKCVFKNNIAQWGAALYSDHEILIDSCEFRNNSALNESAAIVIRGRNSEISNSVFSNNSLYDWYSYYLPSVFNSTYNSYYIYYNNTFRDLQNEIDNAGDVLFLDRDYFDYEFDNPILINKSITIDGRGHIITGNYVPFLLKILHDNVTLKNITLVHDLFVNGHYQDRFDYYFDSAAIFINGSNCSLYDLVINMTTCAVFVSDSSNDTTAENIACNRLYDDSLSYLQYLIYHNQYPIIIQGNAATVDQRPLINVYSSEREYIPGYLPGYHPADITLINDVPNIYIKDNVFYLDRDYKAYSFDKPILINESITIDGRGHTIDGSNLTRIFNIMCNNVTLINITFINGVWDEYAQPIGGGAIYWVGDDGKLINCYFKNNKAITPYPMPTAGGMGLNDGGAVLWFGNNALIDNCRFENNYAYGFSGAIYLNGNNSLISNSKFFNNGAEDCVIIGLYGNNNTVNSSFIYQNGFYVGGGRAPYFFSLPIYNYGGKTLNSYLFSSYNIEHNGDEELINHKFNVSEWYYWFKYYDYSGDVEISKVYDNLSLLMDDVIVKPLTLDEVVDYLSNLNTSNNNSTIPINNSSIEDNSILIEMPNDLIIYYKSSKAFTVKLYRADGKAAVDEKVKFTIGKKVVYAKTDKNGVASLKITKTPGKYSITTEHGQLTFINTVTVKSSLITKDLTKKVKKSATFKVKVLNTKGKAYAKQTVKIKFKGKTYKVKTNSKGIATLKLGKKIKAGKYTIKTTYAGLTNTNRLTVKK